MIISWHFHGIFMAFSWDLGRTNPYLAGWWFGTCSIFPVSWEFHHPNWRTPSFFRGVPPTSWNLLWEFLGFPVGELKTETARFSGIEHVHLGVVDNPISILHLSVYNSVYMYRNIYIYTYVCIYIYTYRPPYIYIHVNTYHIYIYCVHTHLCLLHEKYIILYQWYMI